MCNGEWKDHKSAGEGRRLARQPPPLQRGRSAVRDQERQDRPRRRAQGRGAEEVERLIDRVCRSGFSRELLLPLLRRQGRAGEGCLLDQPEPWPHPPSLPLPSQGEGPRQELAAEPAPAGSRAPNYWRLLLLHRLPAVLVATRRHPLFVERRDN